MTEFHIARSNSAIKDFIFWSMKSMHVESVDQEIFLLDLFLDKFEENELIYNFHYY